MPKEVPDGELFSMLSDFYLTTGEAQLDEAAASAENVEEISCFVKLARL